MKAKTVLLILAAATTLAACSSDESTSLDNNTTSAVKFSGGISTRASGTAWTSGDLVGITAAAENSGTTNYANEEYTSDVNGNFTYVSSDEIYYKDANAVDFTAYYPFSGPAGTAASTVTKTISATDESSTGQPAIDYLYATKTGVAKGTAVTFAFAHKMSELTLTFISGTGSPDITSLSYTLSGIILAGTFIPSTGVAATSGTTTGSLSMSSVNTSSTLILFPNSSTSSANLSVTSGSVTYTATFTVPIMTSGNNYAINVTINKTGLSVSGSTITNWTSGGTTTATATV